MFTATRNRLTSMFTSGYDVISQTGKRKASSKILKHEDEQLRNGDRRQMIGTGRELARNYSIVSWAVRKHLDYVTQFEFQMRTEDKAFNEQVEKLMAEWSRPANCDIAGRHSFHKMLRLFEARRILDGDVFCIKRSNGTLQPIEGELVRNPDDVAREEKWYNGVKVNRDGRAVAFGLHRRGEQGRHEYLRRVSSRNMIQHGHFDRFDQVRGVSPMASAFNSFRDVYDGVSYALAKLKVEQLFALVVNQPGVDGMGDHTKVGEGYDVDFGRGPIKLELEPGEDAKFLKTDNPGSDTQDFLHLVLGMALKSLDIPFSFYKEDFTNFFGSKASFMQYDRSCTSKRAEVVDFLRKITVWRMQLWIQDGIIRLPSGMTLSDVPWEYVPRGMPWWDPAKEIKGDLMAIGAGLDNPYRVCKERGRGEFEENVEQIARAKEFADSLGVDINFSADAPMQQPPAEESDESDDSTFEEDDD